MEKGGDLSRAGSSRDEERGGVEGQVLNYKISYPGVSSIEKLAPLNVPAGRQGFRNSECGI
jgi:hypothetical protein